MRLCRRTLRQLPMLALMFLHFLSSTSLADSKLPPQSASNIAIDLSAIPVGGIGIRYEQALLPFLMLTIPLDTKMRQLSPLPADIVNSARILAWSMFPEVVVRTGVGIKFHHQGWYVEPMLKLGYAQIHYLGQTGTKHTALIQPALYIGYNTTLDFGLFINVGLGVTAQLFLPSKDAKSLFLPDGVLAIGYGW